nr:RNA-directed DNA polymerase, eukaryota [Tanacetum cinerariifolium]
MLKKAGEVKKDTGVNEVGNSYVHMVKGQMQPENKESEATPTLVLSDECLSSKDLSKSLFGRVKQFASLANITKAVSNECFTDIKIQYMGELWVLLEFVSEDSMKLFQDNVSIGSWFSQLKQASMEFNPEGRISWVEVKGIPFQLWSDNTFKRIATKWGELYDIDDQDEMCFHSKRLCIYIKSEKNIFEEFKIIFRGRDFWIRAKEAPGWVPDFIEENDDEEQNDYGGFNVHESASCGGDSDVKGVLETIFEESGQKENNLDEEHTDKQENHSGDSFSIHKLLKKKKENVEKENNSEHSMKYPPSFTPKEGTDVVGMHVEESRSDNIVNLSDHNAKEVNNTFSGNCPKKNSKEYVSNSVCAGHFKTSMVPRIGGSILSLIDELVKVGQVMGYKMDGCMSNMTEIIESQGVKEGVWGQTGNDLFIITVYAPHDLKDKQILWDYLTYEIGKWKWQVVIMDDFNEVRYKSDMFGSVFNVQRANVFNSFITNAMLEEVPLGGSSFTWSYKSATKMSKLDIFLISKNLLNTCLNITAITLERYLSDHRPILLRESHFDYRPTSFRFFHHWIEMEGFSKVVKDAWREGPCDESNAMINMMIKLKYLKTKIRGWNKKNMLSAKNVKEKYKDELEALEAIVDKSDGIMVDGMWIESPNRVKGELFHHFSSRFDKPDARRGQIKMRYPNTLTCDQQVELESDVSNEEIKRAVWDFEIDKSPSPDGYTFGFYRRFWNLIEIDVYDAVKYFFTYRVISKGCNSSFIALIPKIPDANTVKDFRPISLIGSLYKIVAKILVNRLVGVLGDVVNEVQSAFIAEKQILDGPFILNEVLQWCNIKKKQSLIFKVDFEKAYDSVQWDFLDYILKIFGFGEKWCQWIQSCLRSSRGSIIIIGSLTKEFQFFKCLKQGIKLSSSLIISHMFYADDAVFVGQCDKVKCAASKLGCLILKTPFSYLGSKVGGSMYQVHTWNEVVDWVKNRLSKWKMKTLSIGEKEGIGVSSLYALNRGLMFKWMWMLYTQNTSLWVRVIKAIHGDDGKVEGYVKDGAKSCWLKAIQTKNLKNKEMDKKLLALTALLCFIMLVSSNLANGTDKHTTTVVSHVHVASWGRKNLQYRPEGPGPDEPGSRRMTTAEQRIILDIVPFAIGKLPVRYLGVPLITKKINAIDFLSAMQIYWASVFLLPKNVIYEMNKLLKGFLWCQGELTKGKAKSYLLESLLNRDTLMASSPKFDSFLEEFFGELAHTDLIPPGINEANYDPEEDIHLVERLVYDTSSPRPLKDFNFENSDVIIESFSPSPIPVEDRDNLFLERLLHDDPIPLTDILDFSNVVRVFLPFFTYLVTSLILLSSGSEDIIFDPGISDYHFSSFILGVSHRSGTFMKFIVYPNHLNDSPMKILSSTCSPMDQ